MLPRHPCQNSQSGGGLDGLRLQLIEDNPLTQRITVEMLNTSGAQVVAVGNAAQALETLQNNEPFVAALVDFDLPESTALRLPDNWHSNIRRWF